MQEYVALHKMRHLLYHKNIITMEFVFTIFVGVVIGAVDALPMFLKKWIRQTVGLLSSSMWW